MIIFDVLHPYYLPQYFPVMKELERRNITVKFVFYRSKEQEEICHNLILEHDLDAIWMESSHDAINYYREHAPDWVVFGNAVDRLDTLKGITRTALMQHGVGPKTCYYDVSNANFDLRFVEGPYRLARLKKMFPGKCFVDTGYAKLDPIINGEEPGIDLKECGLIPGKKTLLYAPTYYPSSIELMDKKWPLDFSEYNIIIKPHHFSLVKSTYKKQAERLNYWSGFDNVYLSRPEQTNLLPFMASADLLISDASSSLFEFAALNKPVVWCDFYYLRWSYRGIFHYRFKKRVNRDIIRYADIATHAKDYSYLKPAVLSQFHNSTQFELARKRYVMELVGKVDGRCSERIVDYLLSKDLPCV